jgi:succinyl-diaminopimelate desuccinylase
VVRLDDRLHKTFRAQSTVFDPPGSTFEPTKHEANVPNVNTIPGEEKVYLDCRINPDYTVDQVKALVLEVMAEIEKEFKVKISIDYPNVSHSAPATSVDAPVVKLLDAAIQAVRGVSPKPMGIGGGTVAALFRRHGIPAAVWSTMDDVAHQPNEYCLIDNMVQDAKVFAHVFIRG